MNIVDPQLWLRRQRDERLRDLEAQLAAGAETKLIRKAMRRVRRDYWRAVATSRAPWSSH